MLLLARIDDRLWTQEPQHPAHSAELCRWHNAGNLLSSHFSLQTEFTAVLRVIVQNDVSYNAGAESGDWNQLNMAIRQLFTADYPGSLPLVHHSGFQRADLRDVVLR
jgi:hypothetical protein